MVTNLSTTKKTVVLDPPADVSCYSRKWLDIPYAGISQSQLLDIYLPDKGEGPFPVILFIAGGEFAFSGRRRIRVYSPLKGLRRGYAVVSMDHRLSDEAIFPAHVQDVKAAIRWVKANSNKYSLDGSRIAVWGISSGGNLAAMACLTANVTEFDDPALGNVEYPCNIQAAVDWCGPTDFSLMDEQLAENGYGPSSHSSADSSEAKYLGGSVESNPLKVELANPMTYVHKNMPPLMIQHGRLDPYVPVQQSIIFAEKLDKFANSGRFEFEILEGEGHGGLIFESDSNVARVLDFLDKHLKKEEM
jgi:acetyl esterase/lipase